MKKVIFSVLLAAIAVAVLVWASGVAAAYFFPLKIVPPEHAELATPPPVRPGDMAETVLYLTLPADISIAHVSLAGDNIAPVKPVVEAVRWAWNSRTWLIRNRFRVLADGKLPGVTLNVSLRRIWSSAPVQTVSVKVPEINAQLDENLTESAELQLAGEILPPEKKFTDSTAVKVLIVLLIVLVVLAIVSGWLYLRRKRSVPLTPWERALRDIAAIDAMVQQGDLAPEAGFAGLCDVVRNYLEERWFLPASRLTTAEFLEECFLPGTPLNDAGINYLHRFLNYADQVKFARVRSDKKHFSEAAHHASGFITSTVTEESKA